MKRIANIITFSRIMLTLTLIFYSPLSVAFYLIYIICGITDMIDGYIARKTESVSDFGAKLDSIADLIFIIVCILKFFSVIELKIWLWVWILVITVIRMVNIISGFICEKQLVMMHTMANKISGLLLFVLPLTISVADINITAIPVCAVATFAAVQEGHFIRIGRRT